MITIPTNLRKPKHKFKKVKQHKIDLDEVKEASEFDEYEQLMGKVSIPFP